MDQISPAITGLGVITAFGIGADGLFDGLMRGSAASVVRVLEAGVPRGWPAVPVAAVDDLKADRVLAGERLRMLSRGTRLLLGAARLALADAGLDRFDGSRVGVVISTSQAGLQDYAELFLAGISEGMTAVKPALGPQTGLNAPASHLSIRMRAAGPSMTICNGSTGGLDALSYARDALGAGRADVMLVGGVETLARVDARLLRAGPAGCSQPPRPFDRRRRGPMHGEAAVLAVLESDSAVRARSAAPRARLGTIATAFSAGGEPVTSSRRCLLGALEACSLPASAVVGCVAAANGSIVGDAGEAWALSQVLGDCLPVCAVKGAVGECEGAAAMVQVAAAVLALERRVLPPTHGYEARAADLPALNITTAPVALEPGPLLVSAWDESCQAASLVLHPGSRGLQLERKAGERQRPRG